MNCHEALEWLGAEPSADPQQRSAELREHLTGCAQCQQYEREMRALDDSIKRALEVELTGLRQPGKSLPTEILRDVAMPGYTAAPPRARDFPPRRWALAASVLLAIGVGVSLWALRSQPSLAAAVVDHMAGEQSSWSQTAPLGQSAIDSVLAQTGVHIDAARTPVVYASSCRFRGQHVPHLVVHTDQGPVTVMLLRAEKIAAPQNFAEGGYRGVIWPAPDGRGSIAVLERGAAGGDLGARATALSAQMSWSRPAP